MTTEAVPFYLSCLRKGLTIRFSIPEYGPIEVSAAGIPFQVPPDDEAIVRALAEDTRDSETCQAWRMMVYPYDHEPESWDPDKMITMDELLVSPEHPLGKLLIDHYAAWLYPETEALPF